MKKILNELQYQILKNAGLLTQADQFDFSTEFNKENSFDDNTTLCDKLIEILEKCKPFYGSPVAPYDKGSFISVELNINKPLEIKNLSKQIMSKVKRSDATTLSTMYNKIYSAFINHIFECIKNYDDTYYNGSIINKCQLEIATWPKIPIDANTYYDEYIRRNNTSPFFTYDHSPNSLFMYPHISIKSKKYRDLDIKFSEIIDNGQMQIDL